MSLKERRDIAELYRRTPRGVLFTLTAVRGSSYRRAGARLFAAHDGTSTGTISGGCLETELLRRSEWYVRDGARVRSFTTAFDDTAEIPYGLGCGGEVDLLAEPADSAEALALVEAVEATLHGDHRTVATLLPLEGSPLQRFVMDARGDVLFASDSLETEDIVPLRRMALSSAHGALHAMAHGQLFVERLEPVQRLVIFGAGEDARPLAAMAHHVGWRVAVVDTRPQRVTRERFPLADELTVATDTAMVRSDDAVMVMTHSYEQDRHLVAKMLSTPPRFVGLLGARHRSALLLKEAAEMAGVSLKAAVEAVHAPVGLELGGEGPEAIALAIVAEVQQALYGESATTSRRMSPAEADAVLADGPVRFTDAACAMEVAMTTEVR